VGDEEPDDDQGGEDVESEEHAGRERHRPTILPALRMNPVGIR
jgi:hypothetical protein